MDCDFGETDQTKLFFDQNPRFEPLFAKLLEMSNKCFARESSPKNRCEDICFGLGHTCREDFIDLVYLAAHGRGRGTYMLLRPLYERALNLAYMVKNPEKAERFAMFSAIQNHRTLIATLGSGITEQQWDAGCGRAQSVADIRDAYSKARPSFEITLCETCQTKRPAVTWDIDMGSMAKKIGPPYDAIYFSAYSMPTLAIHATAASAAIGDKVEDRSLLRQQDARLAVITASFLMIRVIESQNVLFSLGLESEIDSCEKQLTETWSITNGSFI